RLVAAIERADPADIHRNSSSRLASILSDVHSCCTALYGLLNGGIDGSFDRFSTNGYLGGGQVAAFHFSVSDDHDFIEQFGVGNHDHIQCRLAVQLDFLTMVSDV